MKYPAGFSDSANSGEAREYIFAILVTIKKTENKLAEVEHEKAKWVGRVKLAKQKGDFGLALQAEQRAEDAGNRLAGLRSEILGLRRELDVVKTQIPALKARELQTVDAERLAVELEMLAGKPDKLENHMSDLEAEQELKRLKEKLGRDHPATE